MFIKNVFLFYQKMHTFSFIKISAPFWMKFSLTFVTNETFEILLHESKLIRYYYFINIYIIY